MHSKAAIGVVIIGRNEGERLKRCLHTVLMQVKNVVYVDSGSSDGSVDYAKSLEVTVAELDMRTPFSAGRARNEGFSLLDRHTANLEYVQFIDGDCELSPGWVAAAVSYLDKHEQCAIVAGRRKEKYPEQSVYNLLCDIEWNTPVGEAEACGGDFMIRKSAFQQVGGFNPTVIAGEEPEMCYRLRKRNWLIFRLDHPMTMHDAAITRFSQWWKRYVRTGHAYAQGFILHARDGKRYCLKQALNSWFWVLIFPLSILIFAFTINYIFLTFYITYLFHVIKIAFSERKRINNIKHSLIYSFFTVIGKCPQFFGQLLFLRRKLLGNKFIIIEY